MFKVLREVKLVLALVLLVGCSLVLPEREKVIRVGPGECVALTRSIDVVAIGQGCEVKRLYR